MIFAVKFKKCRVVTSIHGIIINKLCYKKKSCPIILFEFNKSLKISLYCIIFF